MNENITLTKALDNAEKLKNMRRTYSRCGWALFGVTAFAFLCSILLGLLMSGASDEVTALYGNNFLFVNEILVTAAFLVGILILTGVSGSAPEKRSLSVPSFFTYLLIIFAIAWVGSLIGTMWLMVWNLITGNEVGNQVADVMMDASPLQTFLCAGLIAPIIEEFFFRKVLIDRMHKYSELAAILTSALFFGLFHQNFSQFFYAFGIGVVLGYLYCKTGSYLAVTALHVVFNIFRGILPSLFTPKVLEFGEYANNLGETELINSLTFIIEEYGVALLIFLLYSILLAVLNIIGAILLIVNYKKIALAKGEDGLTAEEKRGAIIRNAGIIAAVAVTALLTVASLFTS